jgi:Flp pilus assembly protein TadD
VISPAILTGALALLYTLLSLHYAAPGIVGGDSPELTAACVSLGSAHAPGYPLYVILGRLISLLPVGSSAFRLTFLSILAQTGAFILLSGLLNRHLRSWYTGADTGRFSSLLAFFWMISPKVHSQAASPEVYSLALLMTVFLASCIIETNVRTLLAASFAFGLALAHHHLVLLLFPALFWSFRSFLNKPRFAISSITSFFLGLSLYLMLPIRSVRDPLVDWGDPSTFHQFWFHVTRAQYGGNVRSGSLLDGFADLGIFIRDLSLEIWVLGAVAVLAGILAARRRPSSPMLLAFLATLLGVPLLIRVPATVENANVMEAFLPPMIVLSAPFAAQGLFGLWVRTAGKGRRVLSALLLLLLTVRVPWSAVRSGQSRNLSGEDLGRDVLMCIPRNAVLYSEGDTATFPLAYLKGVLALRPDAEVFDRTGGLFEDLYGLLRAERRGVGLPAADLVAIERAHETRHSHPHVLYSEKETAPGRSLEYAGLLFRVTGDGPSQPVPRPDHPVWSTLRPPRVAATNDYLSREAASRYHVMRGEYLLGRDDAAADRSFDEATALGHDNARLFINIGVAHLDAGRDGEALAFFQRAAELAPGMPLAWYNLAFTEGRHGDAEKAVGHYLRAVQLDPSYAAARNNLAYLYMKAGRVEAATAQWEALLARDPGFITAYRDLGLVLLHAQPERARAYLRRYLESAPPGPGTDYVRKVLRDAGG